MATGGHSESKSSDESFDFICTTCDGNNKIVEAVRYCVGCQGYCCQSCTDIHKSFPILKTHALLDVSEGNKAGNQQARLPEFPTERCTIHEGKVIDMFCQTHGDVGCSACIAKDHKSCPENCIYSIPDTIDTLFKLSECKQTRNRLRDMLVSIKSLSTSVCSKLDELHKAKYAAIEEVHSLQRALESLIEKAVDASKKDIETECKKLEDEIQEDKELASNASDDLQESEKKLEKADGNRAQTFVCSKLVEKMMKKVNIKHVDTKVQLSFEARNSLIRYINSAGGISQILGGTITQHEVYKVKQRRDININVPGNNETCGSNGCCILDDERILVTGFITYRVIRCNIRTMNMIDYCTLPSLPFSLACINNHTVAVACGKPHSIIFVSVGTKMVVLSEWSMSHVCFGIAYRAGKLYVTNDRATVYVYDMDGNLLNTIQRDSTGRKLFYNSDYLSFNPSGSKLFVGNLHDGLVCLDGECNYISTINSPKLNGVVGVCSDGRGNIFVVGRDSNNVVQFNEDGQIVGVIVNNKDGLKKPMSVCFHQSQNKMIVTLSDDDFIKVYDLE